MSLIQRLIELQHLERASDRVFAKKFNVHRTTWIRIKNGKTKKLDSDFLGAVLKVYPGLQKEMDNFLSKDATNNSNNFKDNPKEI